MESLLLDKIDQPSDLKKLNTQQVKKLCTEIRHFMLENISKTGGHLASNLGTCLLYTSPSPRDLSTSRMPSSA